LRRDRAFPAAVRGPVLRVALCRLAAIFASEVISRTLVSLGVFAAGV
jgi:hypothetical protein